ncbi:HAD-IA family hydrolase [Baekduia alba]|uniref:HAD-IA family hydrolase n=1 Tax=Baekduia alba TaxID=2997333 RepID=UPI002341BB76|nr:HAD-IA family hydrolase [Baekduia alba]
MTDGAREERRRTGDIAAVLFDVAGTLAMPEERDAWVAGAAARAGVAVADPAALAVALEQAGRPGGPYPDAVPEALAAAYGARDTSPAAHRAAYAGLLATRAAEPLATALYERILRPEGWVAYPDAAPTLRALRERGIAVAAVSNVGFDLRPVLAGLGLLALVDAVVLSYEIGAVKPDPAIFRAACAALAVAPERALMVGDHPEADGGAADAGLRTLILPMSPAGAPHGLAAVLDRV